MGKNYFLQSDFSSGEITPRMFARVELSQYNNGLRECENWVPMPYGGLETRPGTEFVGEVKDSSDLVAILPFKFNTLETYVVELGDMYARFYTDGGRITEAAGTITGTANVSGEIEITQTAHGYTTGDWVVIEDVTGTLEANATWVITSTGANTYTLDGSVYTNAYVSGGTAKKVYEIATPYAHTDVLDINYVQDANNLYLVHPDYEPRVLTRTGASTFSLAIQETVGGPYSPLNTDTSLTMTPSATTGTGITVTASSAYFTSDMAGMVMRIGGTTGSPAEQGYVEFTTFSSSTVMNADVKHTLSGTTATVDWALGAFGGSNSYPSVVGLVQQRIVYGATDQEPQTLWASGTGALTDFTVNTNDDRAFNATLYSEEANVIRWITGRSEMLVGTSGGEFSLSGVNGSALTPTNVSIKPQTAYGSNSVRPVLSSDSVIFVNRSGRRLRELIFSLERDSYSSPDISLLSPHIFESTPMVAASYQQEPYSTIWMVLTDGTMASVTWLREQKVQAWARHSFDEGVALDIVGLPDNVASQDETYVLMLREANLTAKKYIERFQRIRFTDSHLTGVFSSGARTIYGLNHLEGHIVKIVGDAAIYRDQVVVDGRVTIDDDEPDIETVEVGLGIEAFAETVEPEFGDERNGLSFGKKKRWVRAGVRTVDTESISINDVVQPERSTEDLMDEAVPTPDLFDFTVASFEYESQARLRIGQTIPRSAVVLGLYGIVEVGDQ